MTPLCCPACRLRFGPVPTSAECPSCAGPVVSLDSAEQALGFQLYVDDRSGISALEVAIAAVRDQPPAPDDRVAP